jgi:hypothetical protein
MRSASVCCRGGAAGSWARTGTAHSAIASVEARRRAEGKRRADGGRGAGTVIRVSGPGRSASPAPAARIRQGLDRDGVVERREARAQAGSRAGPHPAAGRRLQDEGLAALVRRRPRERALGVEHEQRRREGVRGEAVGGPDGDAAEVRRGASGARVEQMAVAHAVDEDRALGVARGRKRPGFQARGEQRAPAVAGIGDAPGEGPLARAEHGHLPAQVHRGARGAGGGEGGEGRVQSRPLAEAPLLDAEAGMGAPRGRAVEHQRPEAPGDPRGFQLALGGDAAAGPQRPRLDERADGGIEGAAGELVELAGAVQVRPQRVAQGEGLPHRVRVEPRELAVLAPGRQARLDVGDRPGRGLARRERTGARGGLHGEVEPGAHGGEPALDLRGGGDGRLAGESQREEEDERRRGCRAPPERRAAGAGPGRAAAIALETHSQLA